MPSRGWIWNFSVENFLKVVFFSSTSPLPGIYDFPFPLLVTKTKKYTDRKRKERLSYRERLSKYQNTLRVPVSFDIRMSSSGNGFFCREKKCCSYGSMIRWGSYFQIKLPIIKLFNEHAEWHENTCTDQRIIPKKANSLKFKFSKIWFIGKICTLKTFQRSEP